MSISLPSTGFDVITHYSPTLGRKGHLLQPFNPNWHEGGHFQPPCPIWIRFCQLEFYQKFPIFLEVNIDINRVILTPCQAH